MKIILDIQEHVFRTAVDALPNKDKLVKNILDDELEKLLKKESVELNVKLLGEQALPLQLGIALAILGQEMT